MREGQLVNHMDEKLKKQFAKTKLLVSKEEFSVVGLPAVADVQIGGEGFSAVIKERGITTLVLPVEKWSTISGSVKKAVVESPFHVITFSVPSDWSVPGYLAEVSRVLTSEKVNFRAISAHSYEHILIRKEDKERAVKALERLITDCKKGEEEPQQGPGAQEG